MKTRVEHIWQLLDQGDLDGATESLQKLRRDAPRVPEVVAIGGALLAASGEPEEAVEAFFSAWKLAPEVGARYLIDAAELQLYALDDPEAAIESCVRALDITVNEDELIDAVLLQSEALIGLGDQDERARALLAELDGCSIEEPALLCRAGDQYAVMGDLESAARLFQQAIEIDDSWADAHHGLGLIHEARDEPEAKVSAWLRVRELDLAGARPPWHLSDADIEEQVEEALSELPDEVRLRLVNVPMFVEDAPDVQQVREGIDPRLLGLFSGLPLPYQSTVVDGQVPTLERIQLFARNLERVSQNREHFCHELRITVLHETAHFFGLEDSDLDHLGLG